MSLDTEALGGE